MKKRFVFFAGYLCLVSTLVNCTQPTYDLAITDVKLFDSKSKKVYSSKTVLINADTIASIINSVDDFSANHTIVGENRLLTPGFIDTHTHLMQNFASSGSFAPEYIKEDDYDLARGLMSRMYLAYGVTTIIDMGQPEEWMDLTLSWQKNPTPDYPNLFICGGSIVSDADFRQPQHHIEVMNAEDGRKKVREYAAKGLKHMKFYGKLKASDFEAMVDEARKLHITINTHTDNNVVTIDQAMEMGVQNFEHFFTLSPSILNYDMHWRAMNEKYGIQMSPSIDEFAAHMVFFFSYIKENPEYEQRLMGLFDRMAANGATLSTAINVLASAAEKTGFFTSFEYFPIRRAPMVDYTEAQQKQLDEAFEAMMYYLKRAHEKGVKIRVGTDCRYGGRALLHELLLINKTGIPMADVLQIATLNGYEAMHLDQDFGSIEIGKKADLVLFDKNPFDSNEHLFSNKTIIKGGIPYQQKKSLAYELQAKIINSGTAAAKKWFRNAKIADEFEPLNADELRNVVRTFIGDAKLEEARATLALFNAHFPGRQIPIDGTLLINGTYALLREKSIKKAFAFYEFGRSNFPKAMKTLPLTLLMTMLEEGIEAGKARYISLAHDMSYSFDENEMNGVGYLLLQLNRPNEALTIFKLNVKAFPDSWNVYDSLAEAYMSVGKNSLAIENYERSIERNPENVHGKEQLKKLRASQK